MVEFDYHLRSYKEIRNSIKYKLLKRVKIFELEKEVMRIHYGYIMRALKKGRENTLNNLK